MCVIDSLFKRIDEKHDPLDKKILDEIIQDKRKVVKLEEELEQTKIRLIKAEFVAAV